MIAELEHGEATDVETRAGYLYRALAVGRPAERLRAPERLRALAARMPEHESAPVWHRAAELLEASA